MLEKLFSFDTSEKSDEPAGTATQTDKSNESEPKTEINYLKCAIVNSFAFENLVLLSLFSVGTEPFS